MKCRHCNTDLEMSFIDLESAPPSNAYLTAQSLHEPEKWFPLRVLVCTNCWLVQTEDLAQADELFAADYAYFSSYSTTWLAHAERYVSEMIERFDLNTASRVIEIAANDGYLLQYVLKQKIPCLGIEPTAGTAAAARSKGISIIEDFFSTRLARELFAQSKQADLVVANNVLAHVPDINDFVRGFELVLKPQGVATFEFAYLPSLIAENQFDTIYHEHFSYLSLHVVQLIFSQYGLDVFDVKELPTHGGSLRVFAQRISTGSQAISANVAAQLEKETKLGVTTKEYYLGFQSRANKVKNDLLAFLIQAISNGKKVAAYGAAAKGNTLLNYAGVRKDLIPYVVDLNPNKQGKYLPGNRIPILAEKIISDDKPDYVVILPWNLRHEITKQLGYIRKWNGHFVVAVPQLEVI
jgi:SAM-dependent methyltransferase